MECSKAGPYTSSSSKTRLKALCTTGYLASTIQLSNFYFKLEKYRTHNFEEHVQEIVDKICPWYKFPKLQGHQWSRITFATK